MAAALAVRWTGSSSIRIPEHSCEVAHQGGHGCLAPWDGSDRPARGVLMGGARREMIMKTTTKTIAGLALGLCLVGGAAGCAEDDGKSEESDVKGGPDGKAEA